MNRKLQMICALVVTVILTLSLLCPIAAAEENGDQRWNIILLVDASGSMGISDNLELRYDAIEAFLTELQIEQTGDRPNYIAAMAFSGNGTEYDDDAHMVKNITESELLPLDKYAEMNRKKVQQVAETPHAGTDSRTDINTALMKACQKLVAADNGNRSAIFLFTDGVTDVKGKVAKKSAENLEEAMRLIEQNNIVLCGVYLPASHEKSDLYSIVSRAYASTVGYMPEGAYIEINNPDQCVEATDSFLSLLGYNIEGPDKEFTGHWDDSFFIPGIGVEEVTIRVRAKNGKNLPSDLQAVVTDPSGARYDSSADCLEVSKSNRFWIYKIKSPNNSSASLMSGDWKFQADTKETDVLMGYTRISHTNIGAEMSFSVPVNDIHTNMPSPVELQAQLVYKNAPVTDIRQYDGYKCFLCRTDLVTGITEETEIYPTNNKFLYTSDFRDDYGEYDVCIKFVCEGITAESAHEKLSFKNEAPQTNGYIELDIRNGLLQPALFNYDLADCYNDREDGKDLALSLDGAPEGTYFDGTKLVLKTAKCRNGLFGITVTDSQGERGYIDVKLKVTNMTVIVAIILGALVLIAFVILVIILKNRAYLRGQCELEFPVDETTVTLREMLPPTAVKKRRMNLAEMIKANPESIAKAARNANLSREDIEQAVSQRSGELKKVMLSAKKVKDGKRTKAELLVKYGKTPWRLYNSRCQVCEDFVLGYYMEDEELDSGDYDDFDDFDEDVTPAEDDD